ncbi:PAS domain S-box protein [Deinococcus aquaticus]|uniref:PAS domain S-box protein n=1 Tax=Deinococcus aquaticus TaxID=328692 RepID=A0ABY7V6M3_9DEIO|nr:PAS domain S-box protein [Deinococcus aquaticus]WDA60249.1 PAS domain S-box protein [Deinococcus aquaticus]
MPDRETQLFVAMFRKSPIGMALVSPLGRFMTVNDALCALLGYPREKLLTLTFQDITHPDDLDADLGLLRQLLEGEIPQYEMRKRYYHSDGRELWAQLNVSMILSDDGSPSFFVSQIQGLSAAGAPAGPTPASSTPVTG